MHEHAFVGRFAECDRACAELRVEPAPCLVLSLGDELCRPELFELLRIPRVPEGGPRSDRGIEPDIEDVLDTLHRPPAGAREGHAVHVRAVRVFEGLFAYIFKFADRTDDPVRVTFPAYPDRYRDAPVPLPGDAPVPGFLDPVVEPCAACPFGVPRDLGDFVKHFVAHLRSPDEPLGGRPEDDRGLAPPAVPVPVDDRCLCHQPVPECREHVCIRVLDKFPGKPACLVFETTCPVNRADNVETFLCSQHEVVPAVPGSNMHHAGVLHGNKIRGHDPVPDLLLERDKVRERGVVLPPDKCGTRLSVEHGIILVPPLFENALHEVVSDPEDLLFATLDSLYFCVDEVLCNRYRDVCRERPRCCCPDDEVLVLFSGEGELDKDRGVGLVPVLHFGVSDRRLAPWAPVHDTVPAFEHPLLIGTGKRPPRRFDIPGLHGLVGVFKVEPYAKVLELCVHEQLVFYRELPALLNEWLDAERLDILFGFEAQRLLHLDFNGQPVHVVARTVDYIAPVHPVVAQDTVFYDLVPCSAEVDVPGGIGRAIDKEEGPAVSVQVLYFFVGIMGAPVFPHSLFDAFQVKVRCDFLHVAPHKSRACVPMRVLKC